jgi:hypothetical protein
VGDDVDDDRSVEGRKDRWWRSTLVDWLRRRTALMRVSSVARRAVT